MLHRLPLLATLGAVGLLALAEGCNGASHADGSPGGGSAVVAANAARPSFDPSAPRRMHHPRPRTRNGHRLRRFLLEHAGPDDAGEADANTPFGDFWWIGATSTQTSAIPNSGVRMEATVVTAPTGAANGCFSVWTSDVLSNGMWGQIGYSACDIPGEAFFDLTAFFQVWDLNVGADGELLVDQETNDITPGLHAFAMYVQSGTTWAYAVDGNVMGLVDMGSATGDSPYGVATLSEEGDGVAAAFVPPNVDVPVAMEVMAGGTWGPATTAEVENTAGLSGVVGQLQDSNLADDQIIIGGSSPTLANYVPLWSGTVTDGGISTVSDAGAVSEPYVSVACPTANATVGGKLTMPISATSPVGIAAVTVSVDGEYDLDGGSYQVLCNLHAAPYTCEWDTTGESDGQYLLNVAAIDDSGNTTYEWVLVNVSQSASSPCPGPSDGGTVDGGAGDAGLDAGSGGHDASVQDSGSPTAGDGGGEGGPTMSPDGGGTGANGHGASGCGCHAGDDRSSPVPAASAFALLLGLAVRTRRRRS